MIDEDYFYEDAEDDDPMALTGPDGCPWWWWGIGAVLAFGLAAYFYGGVLL